MLKRDKSAAVYNSPMTRAVIANWNSPNPLPLPELAAKYGFNARSVQTSFHRCKRAGVIPEHATQTNSPRVVTRYLDVHGRPVTNPEAPIDPAQRPRPTITSAARIKALEKLAESGRDTAKIAAIRALEDIDRASGALNWLPPIDTADQLTERLVAILRAAGREISRIAYEEAFIDPNTDPSLSETAPPS